MTDDHAVEVEQGDTSGDCCGAALDVGTNTLVCSLIDLTTGRELGLTSAINPQVTHGDDVISRIRFSKTPGGLGLMQREIVSSFNGMIDELARRFGIRRDSIYICSAVGNTAMQHIFLGLSPADLGRAPYRARMTAEVDTLASKSGVDVHPDCRLMMPPMIGGFVGGDIVALILSQRLWVRRRPVLAVDLGTNGEVVLASGGRLLACSTAAGPAFEGERISAGVRAIDGAIEDVRMSARGIVCKRIGRASPVGLCGSGLLSAVGEMVRLGIIDPTGRIRTRGEIEQRWARGRVIEGERGREFVIDRRQMISLSQGDVREVQLGKAAIAAGMKVLCRLSGIRLDEVSEILIAGSFGSSLRSSSVRLAGLVPYEFRGRIKAVGNSAIEGAKLMLTSRKARVEARRIAALTEHVELFSRPEFKEEFYNSMGFPPVDLRD